MLETVHQIPDLLDRITLALRSSPHLMKNEFRIESEQHGHVRISGRVQTFFEKQMAQEAVRRLDGVERIENLVEVTW